MKTIIRTNRLMVSFVCIAAFVLVVIVPPVFAEEKIDAQRLLRIIEEQQQRLDAQDTQLMEQQKAMQEQRKALEELRSEVEALKGRDKMPAEAPLEEVAAETVVPSEEQGKGKSYQALGAAHPDEWPGFYRVPGTNTQYKFSGFAELDLIHDSGDILTPSAFVTQAILTRDINNAQKAEDGRTSFSIQASRLAFETRTPLSGSTLTDPRRVTTFISFDLFNDFSSTSPEFRLREAYGEVTDFLHLGGTLLLGQTWSTYTNLYSIPSTLEFQAPNAIFGTRHPMVRWTMPVGDDFKLKLAAEAPDLRSFDPHDAGIPGDYIESSDSTVEVEDESRWPDGVVALHWERAPFNLSGAFLARDLRASNQNGDTASAFGWGATVQGRINMPEPVKDDFMQFSLTYGEGIGGVMNDVPPDAVYDVAKNDLKPIPTLAWFLSYQHWWSQKFYSLGTYGYLRQENEDIQAPTAYRKTQYATLNFVWIPDPRWLLGAEVVYGSREDKDGESGSVVRSLITSRFNF